MLVKYAGKIIDGKPTFVEEVDLPEGAEITITIEAPRNKKEEKKLSEEQRAVVANVINNLQKLRKQLTEEDLEAFASLERGDYKFTIDRRLD